MTSFISSLSIEVLVLSDSGELIVASPADLDAPARVQSWSLAAASQAVDLARAAQPGWERVGLAARMSLLEKLKQRFVARRSDFVRLLGIEVGKPTWEAEQEAALLPAKIESTLDEGLKLVAAHRPAGVDGEWRYRAHGVLAVIGPFNFPVHLPNGHIVPALALGNTVIFKPSELTPAVGAFYGQCVAEAGFPPGVFQVVQGARAVGSYLSGVAQLDGVLFTGSFAVGSAIQRANVERPGKLLALELGGKNAGLVFPDADLDRAAYQIAYGGYVTAGQRCSSTSRCLVHRECVDRLQPKLAELARGARVGHFDSATTFMGPLISAESLERFSAALRSAPAEAVVPSTRESVPGRRGHYLRPSLHRLEPAQASSAYGTAELFGPDIALIPFDSEDHAVELANGTAFGLCASVFTADRGRFERLSGRLRAGMVNWNSPTVGASGKLPFGGVENSGNHRPAGIFSALYCAWPMAISFGESGPTSGRPVPGL